MAQRPTTSTFDAFVSDAPHSQAPIRRSVPGKKIDETANPFVVPFPSTAVSLRVRERSACLAIARSIGRPVFETHSARIAHKRLARQRVTDAKRVRRSISDVTTVAIEPDTTADSHNTVFGTLSSPWDNCVVPTGYLQYQQKNTELGSNTGYLADDVRSLLDQVARDSDYEDDEWDEWEEYGDDNEIPDEKPTPHEGMLNNGDDIPPLEIVEVDMSFMSPTPQERPTLRASLDDDDVEQERQRRRERIAAMSTTTVIEYRDDPVDSGEDMNFYVERLGRPALTWPITKQSTFVPDPIPRRARQRRAGPVKLVQPVKSGNLAIFPLVPVPSAETKTLYRPMIRAFLTACHVDITSDEEVFQLALLMCHGDFHLWKCLSYAVFVIRQIAYKGWIVPSVWGFTEKEFNVAWERVQSCEDV